MLLLRLYSKYCVNRKEQFLLSYPLISNDKACRLELIAYGLLLKQSCRSNRTNYFKQASDK